MAELNVPRGPTPLASRYINIECRVGLPKLQFFRKASTLSYRLTDSLIRGFLGYDASKLSRLSNSRNGVGTPPRMLACSEERILWES
jgi:hypothetical protein